MDSNLLTKLPREILLHIFKHFLDLPELWCLTKVSRDLSAIATSIIKKQWLIDNKTPMLATSLLKIQTHAAMISLSSITLRLIQRIKIYDPYAYPPFLSVDRHLKHQRRRQQEHEEFPLFSTATTQQLANQQNDEEENNSEDDDDSDTSSLYNTTSCSPLTSFTFPPTIEPGLDDIANETGFIMERFKYHSERLHHILLQEAQLHQRILQGLLGHMFSGNMEYPIRSAMDIIFHHAVFITSARAFQCRVKTQRRPNLSVVLACTNSEMRCFAAAIGRLFCAMTTQFTQSEIVVTKALWDTMLFFWTFTEHRLRAAIKALPSSSSTVEDKLLDTACYTVAVTKVLSILFHITACFNLIGACYVAQILNDDLTLSAIRKMCDILEKQKLVLVQKALLLNLMDTWLSMDRHTHFRSIIQQELGKISQ
jgi:hypothetical protein